MRIICLVDSLGSGGAQRQLCMLAAGLKRRGHAVRMLVYHPLEAPLDHFLPMLREAGITCEVIPAAGAIGKVVGIRRLLRHGWQDAVLAFLEAPSMYGELAGLPRRNWGLVVGERSANPGLGRWGSRLMRQFHRVADAVVCNSHTNRLMLEEVFPWMRRKTASVYNAIDLVRFAPAREGSDEVIADDDVGGPFRIVVAASLQRNKNMMNVARALIRVRERIGRGRIVVDWFGGLSADHRPHEEIRAFVGENSLADSFVLHSATREIVEEYRRCDAVGLFSYFEGLPNVVCGGMACGKPIIMSDVCDAGGLVVEGENGVLCDPDSPEDVAEKMIALSVMSRESRSKMGLSSRRKAERLFSSDVVVALYERILVAATQRGNCVPDIMWPEDVPQSSLASVENWRLRR